MSKQSRENPQLREYWNRVKDEHKAMEGEGFVRAVCRAGRIQVVAPYMPGFPAAARAIGGRWRVRSRCWSFPGRETAQKTALSDLLLKFHDKSLVPDIHTLPSDRAATKESKAEGLCTTERHLWEIGSEIGDDCQCGAFSLYRQNGRWTLTVQEQKS